MAHGRIKEYDPDHESGYIVADGTGDEVPFTREDLANPDADGILPGEHVVYEVEGGLAGIHARNIRPAPRTGA